MHTATECRRDVHQRIEGEAGDPPAHQIVDPRLCDAAVLQPEDSSAPSPVCPYLGFRRYTVYSVLPYHDGAIFQVSGSALAQAVGTRVLARPDLQRYCTAMLRRLEASTFGRVISRIPSFSDAWALLASTAAGSVTLREKAEVEISRRW